MIVSNNDVPSNIDRCEIQGIKVVKNLINFIPTYLHPLLHFQPLVRDKLTSLEAEMRYSLVEQVVSTSQRLNRQLFAILDLDDEAGLVSRDSVSIQKNCGKDNVCIPDLKMTAVP